MPRPSSANPGAARRASPRSAGLPEFSREVWITTGLFILAAAVLALRSSGAYHDDDLDHYFMARGALARPEFLLNAWGRPAFTILYALPAQLGWTATRLFTLLLAALTVLLTVRAARLTGFGRPWLAGALAAWQPFFYMLSFSALTEPLAGLLVAVILWGVAEDRPDPVALAAGLLPLARLELIIVAPLVAIWAVRRGAWKSLPWLPLPLLAWAVTGALVYGDPGWLPGVIQGTTRPLRSAGPVHYLRNVISVFGPVAFLGLLFGLAALVRPRRETPRPWLAGGLFLLLFAGLTALTWEKLPLGGSIGFLRHLVVLAAPAGLLAAAGYEWLGRLEGRGARLAAGLGVAAVVAVTALYLSHRMEADFFVREGRDWSRLIGLLPAALLALAALARPGLSGRPVWAGLLVAAAALYCLVAVRPLDLNVEQKTVRKAVEFLQQERLLDRTVLANHPWVYFLTGRDRWDRLRSPYVTRANLGVAPVGSLVFWENHYGQRLYGDVPVEELRADPRYQLLFEVESGDRTFRVVVFERIR